MDAERWTEPELLNAARQWIDPGLAENSLDGDEPGARLRMFLDGRA